MPADRPADTRRSPSAPSAAQDEALRGASAAFGKASPKSRNTSNTYIASNGARAAATKANRLEAPTDDQRLIYQRSGGSSAGSYTPDVERRILHYPTDQTKSPSFIAATLAASRSVTPNHTGQKELSSPALRKRESYSGRSIRSVSSMGSLDQPLDTSSIMPTEAMIRKFEQNAGPPAQGVKKKRPDVNRSSTSMMQESSRSMELQERPAPALSTQPPAPVKSKPTKVKPEIKSPKPILPASFSKPALAASRPVSAPKPTVSKPIPIPGKKPQAAKEDVDASSNDSFVSASSYAESEHLPSFRVGLQKQKTQKTSQNISPGSASAAAVESLANAIVASSLASSRAASPSKLQPPPPPAPRRGARYLFHNGSDISRTPSPSKPNGLRTTMRKPREEEIDESEKRRGRKNLMKKHPNKHHEGDRKRWRDEITERERKRYEAVWASNRGIFSNGLNDGAVCNLVARDIFSRSRLHNEVLEEVYALVDRKENRALDREEFVVGLWLIDQRLKGRKLPIRVSDSVWRSVGILGGIKVKKVGK